MRAPARMSAPSRRWAKGPTLTPAPSLLLSTRQCGLTLTSSARTAFTRIEEAPLWQRGAGAGGPPQPPAARDDSVRADGNVRVDGLGLRLVEGHAGGHQRLGFAPAQHGVHSGELRRGIDPENLLGVAGAVRGHALPALPQQFDGVGQVVLAVDVVPAELSEPAGKLRPVEDIGAGVDLAEAGLLGPQRPLLDNGLDAAGGVPHDAAITARLPHLGRQPGGC